MSDRLDYLRDKWISGQLSEEEMNEFMAMPAFEEYEMLMNESAKLLPPQFDKEKLYLKISKGKKSSSLIPIRSSLLRAAAVLILVTASFLIYWSGNRSIEGSPSEILVHHLPDGSTVQLNDHSQLSYNIYRWRVSRIVRVSGSSFFEVSPGKKFTVNTAGGNIQVLGTSFDVLAYDESLQVTCYEGRVRTFTTLHEHILNPGDFISYLSQEVMSEGQINLTDQTPPWMSNQLLFRDTPASIVLGQVASKFNVQIESSAVNTNRIYTGSFEEEPLEQVIEIITESLNWTYEIREDEIILNE